MATDFKTIGYSLYENKLTDPEQGKSYWGRIKSKGRVEQSDLVNMITERNSTVTRQEVTAVLDLLEVVIKTSIQMGYNVHTGIFSTRLSMKGVFDSSLDEFDKDRHKVVLRIKASSELKDFVNKNVVIEKTKTVLPTASVSRLYDYASDTFDSIITPGHTIDLNGEDFQIDPEDERQGVFFLNEADTDEFKSERIISCTAKKIVCLVPADLGNGDYKIEVRCGFGERVKPAQLESAVTLG